MSESAGRHGCHLPRRLHQAVVRDMAPPCCNGYARPIVPLKWELGTARRMLQVTGCRRANMCSSVTPRLAIRTFAPAAAALPDAIAFAAGTAGILRRIRTIHQIAGRRLVSDLHFRASKGIGGGNTPGSLSVFGATYCAAARRSARPQRKGATARPQRRWEGVSLPLYTAALLLPYP